MKERITWSNEEWLAIATSYSNAVKINLDRVKGKDKMLQYEVLAKCQEVLPANRRRKIVDRKAFEASVSQTLVFAAFNKPVKHITPYGMSLTATTPPTSDSIRDGLYVSPYDTFRPRPMHTVMVEESIPEPGVKTELPAEMQTLINSLVDKHVESYKAAYTQKVAEYVSKQVELKLNKLEDISEEEVDKQIAQEVAKQVKLKEQKTLSDKRRPRVIIVGVKGSNIRVIQDAVKDDLRMTFIEADESIHQLRETCRNADYVMMMRGFVSHRHTDVINKRTHSGFIMIQGGMDELIYKLAELA